MFDDDSLSARDIKGRGETKGVGYVEAALYKKGLLNYVVNKKIDDYTRWPQPFKQQLIDTVANHQAFRKACGFTPNAAAHPDATVDLTWLAAFPESLALVMSFLEVTSKNKIGRSSDRHPWTVFGSTPFPKSHGCPGPQTIGRSSDRHPWTVFGSQNNTFTLEIICSDCTSTIGLGSCSKI